MSRRYRLDGNRARDARDWPKAARLYRYHLAISPADFAIWVQYGHMLSEIGDLTAAAAAYLNAYALRPGDADLAVCRGHLAIRSGDGELAKRFYQQSFELNGNSAAADELSRLRGAKAVGDEGDLVVPPVPTEEDSPTDLAEPPVAGHFEGWFKRSVWGTLIAHDPAPYVDFYADGKLVGSALASERDDGTLSFRAVLDIELGVDGQGVEVEGRRMPGGDRLTPAAVLLNPPPRKRPKNRRASSVAFEMVKPFDLEIGSETLLYVTHSRTGKIKPHVLPCLRALKAQGLAIFLIATVDRPIALPEELMNLADAIMVRRNAGYDFGAWSHVLSLYPQLYGASLLYLTNDSVIAASAPGLIGAVIDRVRGSSADVVALTDSHEWRWHVQSYFLALKPPMITARNFHAFMSDVEILDDKDDVIWNYELAFGEMAEASGCHIDILFPSTRAFNPALFDWRKLAADGMPFVKLLLLRGEFEAADIQGWRETLADHGFDISLIEAAIAASDEQIDAPPNEGLLSRSPPLQAEHGSPLKIAFYGPWNYDNGLGAASRGAIAAIRRIGVRLNLHPVKQPFHVHKPLSPPMDILDFADPADIAVVHLNPDSWHLLTDHQLADIQKARHRIGYWVWEMDRLPPAWAGRFNQVDRIWAPSEYCADIFRAHGEATVDVIPHVVPVAAAVTCQPTRSSERFGLGPERKVILYIFDGSSYLVRKNPAALVRAFSASGLAARGWSLLLKSKHLHDRPAEGEAFLALVGATDEVSLIDRSMSPDELRRLLAVADIYASPHCSEGFGLTIAEAMAAGKSVIATDYGGSRDLLNEHTGWPVRAHSWRLGQSFGHYFEGGAWARIDEPALTATLIRAADAIDNGDLSKGEAARKRVTSRLSYDAVSRQIAASFEAVSQSAVHEGCWISTDLAAGYPLATARLSEDLHILPFANDGSLATVSDDCTFDPQSWVLFAPNDSILSPLLERDWRQAMYARPDAGIFYSDDFARGEIRPLNQLRFKPEFDLTLLVATDYIGFPLIVRATVLAELGLRPEMGTAVVNDFLFRAHHAGVAIARITETLLAFRGPRPRTLLSDRERMLHAQPSLAAFSFEPGRTPDTLVQVRKFGGGRPHVSLVIPTCRSLIPDGRKTYIEQLLEAIALTNWPMDRLQVIVGDDIAGCPDWATRAWPFDLRRIETLRAFDVPFNYAAKMNVLSMAAKTEQLVFMNDDLLPINADWLTALVGFAVEDDVGGVGARLIYPDGRLQHAGVGPLHGGVGHVWAWLPTDSPSYQDWSLVQREWSMVTGAVFATRRSLMERVGGFDEAFGLEYNDIDLCLRLRSLGYRIICTPAAEMVHAERASRGETPISGDQFARFSQRWSQWLDDDPAWHPKLRRDRFKMMPVDDQWAWYR